MKRQVEQQLLSFCTHQQARFNPGAWAEFLKVNPDEVACAAATLSRARWYGHAQDLQALVRQLAPQVAQGWPAAAERCGFNREQFVSRLREQLWQRHEPKR